MTERVRVRLLQPVTLSPEMVWPAGTVCQIPRDVAEQYVRDGWAEVLPQPPGIDTTVAAGLVPMRSR